LEVQWVRFFFFDFILHIAYIVDACALTDILPSISFIGMVCFRTYTKATPCRFRASASNFLLIWFSLLCNVVKSIRNRTARSRYVFGSRDDYGFRKIWVSLVPVTRRSFAGCESAVAWSWPLTSI